MKIKTKIKAKNIFTIFLLTMLALQFTPLCVAGSNDWRLSDYPFRIPVIITADEDVPNAIVVLNVTYSMLKQVCKADFSDLRLASGYGAVFPLQNYNVSEREYAILLTSVPLSKDTNIFYLYFGNSSAFPSWSDVEGIPSNATVNFGNVEEPREPNWLTVFVLLLPLAIQLIALKIGIHLLVFVSGVFGFVVSAQSVNEMFPLTPLPQLIVSVSCLVIMIASAILVNEKMR